MNDTTTIMYVGDLDDDLTLVTDSYEVRHTLESLGMGDEADTYGCLFVGTADGDYTAVYGVTRAVPYIGCRAYDLLDEAR